MARASARRARARRPVARASSTPSPKAARCEAATSRAARAAASSASVSLRRAAARWAMPRTRSTTAARSARTSRTSATARVPAAFAMRPAATAAAIPRSSQFCAAARRAGASASPSPAAWASISLRTICICRLNVCDARRASSVSAVLRDHSSAAAESASSRTSIRLARVPYTWLARSPSIPSASRVAATLPPSATTLPIPATTSRNTPTASVAKRPRSSSMDCPVSEASWRAASPPALSAASMACSPRPTAVAPSSLSRPSERIAAANAAASAEDVPNTAVAVATRVAVCAISLSVAAKVLPRRVMTLPKRSTVPTPSPVTARIRARAVAPASPARSVAPSSCATVRVKRVRSDTPCTPSCPAAWEISSSAD